MECAKSHPTAEQMLGCEIGSENNEHIFTVPGVPKREENEIQEINVIKEYASLEQPQQLLCYPTHQKHYLNQHQLVDNKFV